MATTRPELTPEHRTMFRDFVRLVYEMDRCRFVQQYRQQNQTISCGQDATGEAKTTAPDYDWEDFRSFMTIFRKVGIAVGEPTYLAKIYKLIGRYASDALRERLATDRSQVMAMLTGTWTGMQLGGTIDGKEVTFSIADLLDMVTNGIIFHEDPSHRPAVEMFAKEPRWTYLWPAIHFKIMPIKRVAVVLFHYLWQEGILSDADYPQEWQASKRAREASKKNAEKKTGTA
jgi:hypothetical protein